MSESADENSGAVVGQGGLFRENLLSDRFIYGAEAVTSRGFTPPGSPSQLEGATMNGQTFKNTRMRFGDPC